MAKFATQFEADAQAVATRLVLCMAGGMDDGQVIAQLMGAAIKYGYVLDSNEYNKLVARVVEIVKARAMLNNLKGGL